MDDRLDEVLERLAGLERRIEAIERDPIDSGPTEGAGVECSFVREEHRIVDLIVRLVTENVVRTIDDRMAEERSRSHPPPGRRHEPPPPPHASHPSPPPPEPRRGPERSPDHEEHEGHEPRRGHPRRGGG